MDINIHATADTEPNKKVVSLIEFLSNPLFLYRTVPYLPIYSLLALAATSKSFQTLIYKTPNVFRYLDLSATKSLPSNITAIDHGGEVWRNVQLDENVTEDESASHRCLSFQLY